MRSRDAAPDATELRAVFQRLSLVDIGYTLQERPQSMEPEIDNYPGKQTTYLSTIEPRSRRVVDTLKLQDVGRARLVNFRPGTEGDGIAPDQICTRSSISPTSYRT